MFSYSFLKHNRAAVCFIKSAKLVVDCTSIIKSRTCSYIIATNSMSNISVEQAGMGPLARVP